MTTDPLAFKYRLRWYILGKHSETVFTNHTNCKAVPHENEKEETTITAAALSKLTKTEIMKVDQPQPSPTLVDLIGLNSDILDVFDKYMVRDRLLGL